MWSLQSGRVIAACWSNCSSALLFATSTEPVIYALTFGPVATVFNSENTRSATAIIDVTAITLPNGERYNQYYLFLIVYGNHFSLFHFF